MSQQDRHRERTIPIEFDFHDSLHSLPYSDRLSLILISNGTATMKINDKILLLNSPCIVCISQYDCIEFMNSAQLCAKTFSFDPWFIKACLTFDNLCNDEGIEENQQYLQPIIGLFLDHFDSFQGVFELSPNNYLRMNEIMSLIGSEVYSQSDRFWTCRIRRLLLQVLHNVFDIYVDQRKMKFFEKSEKNVVTTCVDYIHINYSNDIRQEDLCELVNLNRTSLNNRFKNQLNCTAMEFLLQYRIQVSEELLAHTNLKLSEIAKNCGFKYDTYFIKQFTAKTTVSPTSYRQNVWNQK